MKRTVCLLSPAPIWVNPRLRKEADSLVAAGYDVVVGYRSDGDVDRDDAILASKQWRWTRIDVARQRRPFRWLRAAIRQKVAELLVRSGVHPAAVDAAAYCRGDDALLTWAAAQPADLFIAHTQPVLAIAAAAAGRRGVSFAFDCEDLLAEEAADGGQAPWRHTMITRIEARYLSRAAYVSATSQPMAEYLKRTYGLTSVPFWHNCFPRSESEGLLAPERRPAPSVVELAWMSATIGPGRGLEDVFAALPRVTSPVVLHLYGSIPAQYGEWFDAETGALKDGRRLEVHSMPAPDGVMLALSRHHIGLTLDPNDCLNRSLTVCNKLFLYLQAGLACVATDTPGQRSVIPAGAPYGTIYTSGDVGALVSAISSLCAPASRLAAQSAAWEVGRSKYCWDVEGHRFLDSVVEAVGSSGTATHASRMTEAQGA
jgi:glycosyltransferase involved in cell wall biosynthesis